MNKVHQTCDKVRQPMKKMRQSPHIIEPAIHNVIFTAKPQVWVFAATAGPVKRGKLGKLPENSENSGFMPLSVDGIY